VIATETLIVLDTSAALDALVASEPAPGLVERLTGDSDLHAPHLIDTELLRALRRLTLGGNISGERAEGARSDFAELSLVRYPHVSLSDRVWELRDNITAYDATFVALAEELGVPLITCDARLASAPGHDALIELYGP
jgi:predicted nucleic acid-binding protein